MSNTTHFHMQILPTSQDGGCIDRNIVSYIKDNDIPFTVKSNEHDLSEAYKNKWSVTSLDAGCSYRSSFLKSGVKAHEIDMSKIEPFLKSAVVITSMSSESDAYNQITNYHFFKDGKEVYKGSTVEEGIFTQVVHEPVQFDENNPLTKV